MPVGGGKDGGTAGDGGAGVGIDSDGLVELGRQKLSDERDAGGTTGEQHGVELGR
jgi:hypothetical protein